MNQRVIPSPEPVAQIDRLVSGDLPEAERRNLLAWLDEDQQRWRTCALAFLESQVWAQAARESGIGSQESGIGSQESGVRSQEPGAKGPLTTPLLRLAIAAGLLVALALGMVAGRSWPAAPAVIAPHVAQPSPAPPAVSPDQPLLATVSVRTNLDPRLQAQLTLPVTPSEHAPPADLSISDYDRKQWERRGFEVSEEIRYLPARLPDGRQVMVPVNKVQLKVKPAGLLVGPIGPMGPDVALDLHTAIPQGAWQ